MKRLELFIIGAMSSDLYNVTHNPLEHMRLRLCAVFPSFQELKIQTIVTSLYQFPCVYAISKYSILTMQIRQYDKI